MDLHLVVMAVMLMYLVICPYTKVEESFNLQAMHDILYHSTNINQYDHLEFPGVVPRSFLGPLVISVLSSPVVYTARLFGASKFFSQIVVRACLGIYVLVGFKSFVSAVQSNFGWSVRRWLLVLTLTQFHFLFYATRPLPNILTLGLVLLALSYWLRQRYGRFIWASGVAVLVFRFDLALFLGLILLMELISGRVSIFTVFKHVLPAGAFILGTTVLVDSYFWQRWVWPEGEVLWFNVVLNKSSDYGTSPFLWYFYSVIPRALACSTALIPIGLYFDRRLLTVLAPAVGFVFLYSFLPHKELRFIIYTFPVFNVAAACGMSRLWLNRSKSPLQWVIALVTSSHLLLNIVITSTFLRVSYMNYPGGVALHGLHQIPTNSHNMSVHLDVFTAQTGASRFLQLNTDWQYNKTEDLPDGGEEMKRFSCILIGSDSVKSSLVLKYSDTHDVITGVEGFDRLKLDWGAIPPVKILTETKIVILKQKNILN